MAENSKIEWTEHTGNIWWGCEHVHTGCDNCYAEKFAYSKGHSLWGKDAPRLIIKPIFKNLAKYQRQAAEGKRRDRVFVGSMMDIFEKSLPLFFFNGTPVINDVTLAAVTSGELREELFRRISNNEYPNLYFLLLTKRPSNINKMIPAAWKESPPENVMFGASTVDQPTFDNLVKHLKKVKGKRFLSMEPQVGPIVGDLDGIDWVIQGGESGAKSKRRPFKLEWATSMREQCEKAGVPYFFKQIDKVTPIPVEYMIREVPAFIRQAA